MDRVTRSIWVGFISLVVVGGVIGPIVVVSGAADETPAAAGTALQETQSTGDLNQSVQALANSTSNSRLAKALQGKQVNVQITHPDGTVVTKGITFGSGQDVTVQEGGYSQPDVRASLSETALESIVASPNTMKALEKAIKYDLVSISATGTSDQLATALATSGVSLAGRSQIAVARVDLDDDPQPDAILEIDALRSDDDDEFDRLVRTVLRDLDDDGKMDTVTSEIRPVASTVTGSVDLDLNDDGTRDTLLRLTGEDTNTDGQLDTRTKTTLVDSRGDPQFDSFTETVEPITPSTEVTGDWDLDNDGTVSSRLTLIGMDTDGDDSFDQQTLTVELNLDDEPGFESTSSTTARINPTLSIAAEFDTDDDGTPDTKASLSASDSNDDGGLDTESVSVVNDTDGNGVYDNIVRRDEFRRGFLSNQGEPIQYLDSPKNLTIIGVMVSILSMLLQLVQGG